jgi:hypothetical protein
MRKQTGLDGQLINIAPRFLVVPAALEAAAMALVSEIAPAQISDSNASVRQLRVVVEPRLDGASATAWFLFSDQNTSPSLALAHLDGEETPMVDSRIGFSVDGMEVKIRHCASAFWTDWRGAGRNAGA